MQVRHRIPSIFNLSMVDVLCCALGCIILLWLVYFKEAREHSLAARQTNKELTATKVKLENVLRDLTSSQQTLLAGTQRNEYLSGQIEEILAQRDAVLAKWEKTDHDLQAALKSLEESRTAAASLRKDVKDLEARNAATQVVLTDKTKQVKDLESRNTDTHAALTKKSGQVKDLENRNASVQAVVAEKTAQVRDLENRNAAALTELAAKDKALAIAAAQAAELKSKLAATEERASNLEKDVAALKVLSKEYGQQLAKTETKAMTLESDLGKRQLELADANKRVSELFALKDRLEQHLAAAKTDLAKSGVVEKSLGAEAKIGQVRIAQLEKDLFAAKTDLAKMAQLEKDLAAAKIELARGVLLQRDLTDAVRNDLNRMARLETDLAAAKSELAKSGQLEKNLTAAAKADLAKIAQLEKYLASSKFDLTKSARELADARAVQTGLAVQTTKLTQQIGDLRAAADNRFAGVEMTGSRVLFLVDMSGSMGMKNDDSEDPDKWPYLCEVLAKLMRSLPDLKEFQIILFSDRVRYPLGNERMWHNYTGPASIRIAVDTVRAVKPQNATNMSAAFEEAFRYRPLGLDTIYLLSDGLPNMGDGLPDNAARLSDAQREAVLGKYVRDRLKSTWNVPYGRWTQQRVRINSVGFYFDSPDVGAFLWALARDNNGSFVGLSKP